MMDSLKKYRVFVSLVCIFLLITSLTGVLFQGDGLTKIVSTVDGRMVEIFGQGPYSNHSFLRATSYIGADMAMLLLAVPLLLISNNMISRYRWLLMISSGVLLIVFYYSISLSFGAPFNRYFLLYIALFSLTGFTFFYSIYLLSRLKLLWGKENRRLKVVTAIFMCIAGLSALVWLSMIIPSMISGDFKEFIDINTTEPTFVLDIGIIFPLFTVCGLALFRNKAFSYWLTPVLLTFYSLVGGMVIIQTIVQNYLGVVIPLPQLISLVVSFILLGFVSLVINIRFLRKLKEEGNELFDF